MRTSSSAPVADLTSLIVRSLVLYSLAEFQAGHATTIRVAASGNSFSVSDNGRGHAIDRVVDGVPYLDLVYGQLEYPLGASPGPAVQLQGIATSLIRSLASELAVTVCKDDIVYRMRFREGAVEASRQPRGDGQERGNTVAGTVRPGLESRAPSAEALEPWLIAVCAAAPGLTIEFNGCALDARKPDAAW